MLIRGAENWNEGIELVLFQHCQTGPVAEIHCPPPGKINAIPPVNNGKGGCIHSNVAGEVIQGKTEHKFRKFSWEEQIASHVFAGEGYIFSCAKISLYSHLHIQPPLPWTSARWGCHVRAHTHISMHARTSFCLAAKADKVRCGTKYRLSVLVRPVQNHRPSGGEKKAISQMMGFR